MRAELQGRPAGGGQRPAAAERRHTRPMEVRSSKLHGAPRPASCLPERPGEWAPEPAETARVSSAESIYAPSPICVFTAFTSCPETPANQPLPAPAGEPSRGVKLRGRTQICYYVLSLSCLQSDDVQGLSPKAGGSSQLSARDHPHLLVRSFRGQMSKACRGLDTTRDYAEP